MVLSFFADSTLTCGNISHLLSAQLAKRSSFRYVMGWVSKR